MLNLCTLGQYLLGRKYPDEKKTVEIEINNVNNGNYILPATPKGGTATLLGSKLQKKLILQET